MKNKWLWITLSVLAVVVLLVTAGFVFFRIGLMIGSNRVVSEITVPTEGGLEEITPEESDGYGFFPRTMWGSRFDRFDRFDRFSYDPRFSMMNSRVSMFSPLRWLGGMVLLGVLVLVIILIVKALSGKTKVVVKTQPEVVEVPPVEPNEQQ